MKRSNHAKAWEVIDFSCYDPSFSLEDEWTDFLVNLEAEFAQQEVNKCRKEFWGQIKFAAPKRKKVKANITPRNLRLLNIATVKQSKLNELALKKAEILSQLKALEASINDVKDEINALYRRAHSPKRI